MEECQKNNIPADQSNLIGMFLRNIEKNLENNGKKEITVRQFMDILKDSNQTLIEPTFSEWNNYSRNLSRRRATLEVLTKDRDRIMEQSEKKGLFYVYLLLCISSFQLIFFYYTIFQVDWLGWDIMEPLTYSVELINVLIAMRFYYKYRSVRGFEQIIKNNREKFINSNPALKYRFRQLEKNIDELVTEKRYMHKSIDYLNNRHRML